MPWSTRTFMPALAIGLRHVPSFELPPLIDPSRPQLNHGTRSPDQVPPLCGKRQRRRPPRTAPACRRKPSPPTWGRRSSFSPAKTLQKRCQTKRQSHRQTITQGRRIPSASVRRRSHKPSGCRPQCFDRAKVDQVFDRRTVERLCHDDNADQGPEGRPGQEEGQPAAPCSRSSSRAIGLPIQPCSYIVIGKSGVGSRVSRPPRRHRLRRTTMNVVPPCSSGESD